MCPERQVFKNQRGSSLVMAVFVLTVMVLLSTALLRSLEQEAVTVGVETTATRAWAAAQSGIDWALARTLNRSDDAAAACLAANGASLTPGSGLPPITAFDRCTVAISCNHRAAFGSDSVDNAFEVKATATCGADVIRVTRKLEALAYD